MKSLFQRHCPCNPSDSMPRIHHVTFRRTKRKAGTRPSAPYPWRHLVTVCSRPSLWGGVGPLRLRVGALTGRLTAGRRTWVLGTKMVVCEFGRRRVAEGMGSRDRGNTALERRQVGPLYLTREQNTNIQWVCRKYQVRSRK